LGLLRGGEPGANAQRVERLLSDGKKDAVGAAAVTLNAAAALYVGGLAPSYKEGVVLARETLAGGRASERLDALRRVSTSG
jgi:anthranilate phosphoribosyltransferase